MNKIDEQGAYGSTLGSYFRLEAPECVTVDWPERTTFAITRVRSDVGLSDFTEPVPPGAAVLVNVALRPVAAKDFDHRFTGKAVRTPSVHAFATTVLDARGNPMCWVRSRFDYLHFHIPCAGLQDIARDYKLAPVETFRFVLGETDPTMAQLAKTILPYVSPKAALPALSLDQISLIVGAHVITRYSGFKKLPSLKEGGLAPWQMRRAEEILRANLDGDIRVHQVAQECGLSVSHFARAFKTSFGVSPIRWVISQRIDLAQQLLLDPRYSLSEIAIESGFGDQSAFARTFLNHLGETPGRWRREKLGSTNEVPVTLSDDLPPQKTDHNEKKPARATLVKQISRTL
jgi:AraC family transcriptional regulator